VEGFEAADELGRPVGAAGELGLSESGGLASGDECEGDLEATGHAAGFEEDVVSAVTRGSHAGSLRSRIERGSRSRRP
jgi:hypothetical protein